MASLATREYLMELEEELEGRLGRAERKMARREVRGLVQDMAFRLAAQKGRPAPEDIDYEIALEAMRPPAEAAEILARRADEFRRRKWTKRARTAGVLLVLVVLGALAVQAMTSETSVPVYSYTNGTANRTTSSTTATFQVSEDYRRLHYRIRGFLSSDGGLIRVTVLDPGNQVVARETFTPESGLYSQGNIPEVPQGTWRLVVDFHDAAGSVRVDLRGIQGR